jgi:hypothetical protein
LGLLKRLLLDVRETGKIEPKIIIIEFRIALWAFPSAEPELPKYPVSCVLKEGCEALKGPAKGKDYKYG